MHISRRGFTQTQSLRLRHVQRPLQPGSGKKAIVSLCNYQVLHRSLKVGYSRLRGSEISCFVGRSCNTISSSDASWAGPRPIRFRFLSISKHLNYAVSPSPTLSSALIMAASPIPWRSERLDAVQEPHVSRSRERSSYLNLAEQRPMTSPWQTSSALNSEPSSVR